MGNATRTDTIELAPPRGWAARLVRSALAAAGDPPVEVVLWDGTAIRSAAASRATSAAKTATVTIRSRRAFVLLMADGEFQLGDCYARGDIEVDGDLVGLLETINRSLPQKGSLRAEVVDRVRRLAMRGRAALRVEHVEHHYDRGNDFYRMWLDPTMTYTCAYFDPPTLDLEQAQKAKLDYVCRKLRLRAGERVVEAGAGWGSLALHMAEHYGALVTAYNISPEQTAYAREQTERRGLTDRVTWVEADFSSIEGRYDAFVSVGMLEHVGRDHYRELAGVIGRCLARDGRGLLHSIGRHKHFPPNRWMQRRIFPEGYVPSLREMMDVFEPADLVVDDVENLRTHYSRTLEAWLARYEAVFAEVASTRGMQFARAWRLYLASSLASFRAGWHQLYQIVFTRAGSEPAWETRNHLYTGGRER